jgi:putative endopeptidase
MRTTLLSAALLVVLAAPAAEAQRRAPAAPVACADFYAHANQAWLLAHPASAAQPERSRLEQLSTAASARRDALFAAAASSPQGPLETTLGRFWAAGIDEAGLESASAPALATALAPLGQLRRPRDLPKVGAAFHALGIAPMAEFIRLDAAAGPGQPLAVVPAALGLGDPAFYTSTDPEVRTLLGRYRSYVEAVLRASGLPEAEISPASEAVLQIETQLAQAIAGEAPDARSADTLRAQDRRYIALGFAELLDRLDAGTDQLVVVNPGYFAALTRIAADKDVRRMQWYLRFRVVNRLAPDLGTAFRTPHAAFFAQTLRGLPAGPSRAEHMQALLRRDLAGLADAAFNAREAPQARRERAESVVDAVRDAAVEQVGKSDPAAAKRLADARLDIAGSATPAFDASGLELRAGDHVGNLLRISRWQEARVLAGKSTAVDPLPAHRPAVQWIAPSSMLAVSAAALAPPLLAEGAAAADARDFGALGALAGHEFAKAIDAGSRGAALGALFNGLQPAPNLRVDGARTLPMNRADLAGLEFAWVAFQKAQPQADVNAKKAFFVGWAELWAKTQTADALRAEVQTSPYAPNALRVNATLAQLPAFGETFGCRVGSKMRAAAPIAVWR